jgi:hypothetical protein
MLVFFFTSEKIQRLRSGSNSQTREPEASMLTTRPPKPSWPWCNLLASQRRPYCASVNSHFPVGLVSQQWDAVDWTCLLCDLSTAIFASGKAVRSKEPNLECRGAGRPECNVMLYQKRLLESCRMSRCIVLMKLIRSLGHFERVGHTVHKLS